MAACRPTDTLRTEGLLRGHDGKVIPVELLSRPADVLAGSRVYSVRDLTEKKSAEGRIHYLAHYDSLTGLPNRSSFLDRLDAEIRQAQDRNKRFALLSFDLDRFKETNDMFGHAAGDVVLTEIARRLKGNLEGGEYAARFGGDEFFALFSAADNPEYIMAFAERILAAVRSPLAIDDNELFIGASVGIAVFPDDGLTGLSSWPMPISQCTVPRKPRAARPASSNPEWISRCANAAAWRAI